MSSATPIIADRPTSALRVLLPFILATVFGPFLVGAAVFGILCAIECTALPWLGFAAFPFVVLALAIGFGASAYQRSAALGELVRRRVRIGLLTSIIWVPVAALLVWQAMSMAIGVVALFLSR